MPVPRETVFPQPPTRENPIQTETLEVLVGAERYNRWIFDSFADALGDRVLEVGCGTGNFSALLLSRARHLTAVDVVPAYTPLVERRLSALTAGTGKTFDVQCRDLFDGSPGPASGSLEPASFDTVVMLNVLEHLADDATALAILRDLLAPGGRLILLVPAHGFLYSPYDRSIHHYRRYGKARLRALLIRQGFEVQRLFPFNLVGALGWWVNFCLLRKTRMEAGSVGLFERLVPFLRTAESRFPPPVGVSLIAVALKRFGE